MYTKFSWIDPPLAAEYDSASAQYIQLVPKNVSILSLLAANADHIVQLYRSLKPGQLSHRYAAGKWTLKEVLLHITDDERIYAYRALRFARGDQQQLHGFDQDAYIALAKTAVRPLENMIAEY